MQRNKQTLLGTRNGNWRQYATHFHSWSRHQLAWKPPTKGARGSRPWTATVRFHTCTYKWGWQHLDAGQRPHSGTMLNGQTSNWWTPNDIIHRLTWLLVWMIHPPLTTKRRWRFHFGQIVLPLPIGVSLLSTWIFVRCHRAEKWSQRARLKNLCDVHIRRRIRRTNMSIRARAAAQAYRVITITLSSHGFAPKQ